MTRSQRSAGGGVNGCGGGRGCCGVRSGSGAARLPPFRTPALVLGAGGVLGAAWMTGALARLADRLPCAPGDVDLIVGTSAGSVLAAALRCRAPFEEMVAWQRGQATGLLSESAALAAQDGPLPPLPRMRFGSVPLARAALLTPHRVPPWVAASAWLPHGRGRHAALRSLITGLQLASCSRPGRPPPTGSTTTPGSRPWTTTPGSGCCSGGTAPRAPRCPTPWSPPAPFPAGTSRPSSAAGATSTAASGP